MKSGGARVWQQERDTALPQERPLYCSFEVFGYRHKACNKVYV
jgi:hypothetical protein